MILTGLGEFRLYFHLGTIQTPDNSQTEITRYPHSDDTQEYVGNTKRPYLFPKL